MSRVLSVIMLLALSLFAEPNWTHSFKEAKEQARKESKMVMVMLSREGCDACWYMENIVFQDKDVNALLKKNFIPVYIDVHADQIPEGFKYIGTPTFYFTDATGNKIAHPMNGASNVKDFTSRVNAILKELEAKQP